MEASFAGMPIALISLEKTHGDAGGKFGDVRTPVLTSAQAAPPEREKSLRFFDLSEFSLTSLAGLKILVSVVRFRPRPPESFEARPLRWAFLFLSLGAISI